MPKEKNYNPVNAQRKADKAKAVKKGKAEAQGRRNEKFAKKNPERLQKQIDDLKAITTNGGKLSKNEEQILDGLEKELRLVKKARETLGDKAPTFGKGWNQDRDSGQGVLGKRRRGGEYATTSDEDVPDDVQKIPMPRDTPPPIPKEVMDMWHAKRRARWAAEHPREAEEQSIRRAAPVAEAKIEYSAAPVSRDLVKEAVAAFVPTVVKIKMNKGQGQGGLMEPEEADRLEREGYLKTGAATQDEAQGAASQTVTIEDVEDEEG